MNIILRKDQQEALDFFEKTRYLILEGGRRSGKTTVLQEICIRNYLKRIGICCPEFLFYERYRSFGKYIRPQKNLESDSFKDLQGMHYDVIIADEINLELDPELFRSLNEACSYFACAYTPNKTPYQILKLDGGSNEP